MAVTRRDARQGLWLSVASICWTACASTAEIILGLTHGVLTLVVFGVAGALDAVGSAALVVHFRHALVHRELADHHEQRATFIVSGGLMLLGTVAVFESARRLRNGEGGSETDLGVAIAATAIVVLGVLAALKRNVARAVDSAALRGDAYLSATGAALAAVAVGGASLGTRSELWWVDPVAALFIAVAAGLLGARFFVRAVTS